MRQAIATATATVSRALHLGLRPLGYLAFVAAVWSLTAAAALLGREHALGGFAGRLGDSIRRYPPLTRPGVALAWLVWGALLLLALSPLDPLATVWDEVALAALASGILWTRMFGNANRSPER